MKTARFREIVKKCGRPEIYLSWVPPERDRVLMAAVKQNRVMTLQQTVRGSAKDYGTVGLMRAGSAQILIFPRSLKRYLDRRVVGIDYDLLASSVPPAGRSRPQDTLKKTPPRSTGKMTAREADAPVTATRDSSAFAAEPDNSSTSSETARARSDKTRPAFTWRAVAPEIAEVRKDVSARGYERAARRLRELADLIERQSRGR